jgi:hypothetical protein
LTVRVHLATGRRSVGDGFAVDLDGLRAFSAHLRADLDRDLWPENDVIGPAFAAGVPFGYRSGSPAVHRAATEYHGRLAEILTFMDALLHNSDVLAAAAESIVSAYQHADELTDTDLRTVLGAASTHADATPLRPTPAPEAPHHGHGGVA